MSVFTSYRQDAASGKLPVLNLLTGQKSGFSPGRGDSLHRFRSNLARPTGIWVRLAVHHLSNGARGGNAAPKYQNFSLFGTVAQQGRTPWPISKIFRGFFTPNYATLAFQIWHDSLHRFIYCWETARRSIRPNFSVHPVGRLYVGSKMNHTYFDGLDVLYHSANFGEDRTTAAVGAKMWCLSLCFLSVTLRVRSTVRSMGA